MVMHAAHTHRAEMSLIEERKHLQVVVCGIQQNNFIMFVGDTHVPGREVKVLASSTREPIECMRLLFCHACTRCSQESVLCAVVKDRKPLWEVHLPHPRHGDTISYFYRVCVHRAACHAHDQHSSRARVCFGLDWYCFVLVIRPEFGPGHVDAVVVRLSRHAVSVV